MAATDIKLSDFAAREFPYISPKTVSRWARQGRIAGAKKDLGGNWVVDMSEYFGVAVSAVNDTGLSDDIFRVLASQ